MVIKDTMNLRTCKCMDIGGVEGGERGGNEGEGNDVNIVLVY